MSALTVVEELARRFRAGQLEAAFALYDPRVRIVQPASLPHGGVHEGHAGVRDMGGTFAQHWARTISEPYRTTCGDGRVLQITQQTWTSHATGRSATVEVLELITVAEGRITEIKVFQQDTRLLLDTLD